MLRDVELVSVIKNGFNSEGEKKSADKAFEILFNKYKYGMVHTVKNKFFNSSEIEDLMMSAFTKAYISIDSFDEERGSFSTWLYRIFNNIFIDYLRREKNVFVSISDLSHTDDDGNEVFFTLPIVEKNAVEVIERKEKHVALNIIIDSMESDFFKRIIRMRYFEELSYEEICSATGKPMGTIKGSLNRAKEILKEKVKGNSLFF